MVVDLELGATIKIGRVDPLTTAEVPVAGVAARFCQWDQLPGIFMTRFNHGCESLPGDAASSDPHRAHPAL